MELVINAAVPRYSLRSISTSFSIFFLTHHSLQDECLECIAENCKESFGFLSFIGEQFGKMADLIGKSAIFSRLISYFPFFLQYFNVYFSFPLVSSSGNIGSFVMYGVPLAAVLFIVVAVIIHICREPPESLFLFLSLSLSYFLFFFCSKFSHDAFRFLISSSPSQSLRF
jgi:hypothetical protein